MRTKEAIQTRILILCEDHHLTLNGLGEKCGISQSTLNNIINGRNNSVTLSTVKKICDGVGISLHDFFSCGLFENLEQEIY